MSEYNIQMNKYNALNAEYDQLYPQPMKHASTHAKDGDDPITPSSIGAAELGADGKVLTSQLPSIEVDAYTKVQTLSDTTKTLFGLDATAVPDDALALLSRFQNGLGNEYVWEKSKTEEIEDTVELTNVEIWNNNGSFSNFTFYVGTGYIYDEASNQNYPYSITNSTAITANTSNMETQMSNLLGKYISGYTFTMKLSQNSNGVWFIPSNAVLRFKHVNNAYRVTADKVIAKRNHRSVTTKYGYVNSPDPNAYPPAVSDGYTYTALGQIGAKANITTGEYTGTGTFGNTNLNSLTFSFFPKAIFIIPVATNMSSYIGQFGAFLYGAEMCSTRFDGGEGSTQCNVTITGWGTNTIRWFGASSNYQLNASNKEYRYVAIG